MPMIILSKSNVGST